MSTRLLNLVAVMTLAGWSSLHAKEEAKPQDTKCPVTGKAVQKAFKTEYEGKTYHFCSGDCVGTFEKKLRDSVYAKIGGKAAVDASIDLFYKKILADDRVNHFFEDVNMKRQIRKQKEFVAAALGGPEPWTGKDLRKAHQHLDLTEKDFGIIAEHLQKTLEELKVKPELVADVMKIVGSTKDAVLNRKAASK